MRPTGHFWPASRINTGCVGFGLVWFGLVWFGLVWFGLVWFGLGLDGLDGWLGDLCRSLCSGSLAAWVTNRPPNACRHPRVAIAPSFPRRRESMLTGGAVVNSRPTPSLGQALRGNDGLRHFYPKLK